MPRTENRDLPRTPIRGRRRGVGEGFKPSPTTMPDGEPWPAPECRSGACPGRRSGERGAGARGSGARSRRPCLSGRPVRPDRVRLLRQAQGRLLRQRSGQIPDPGPPCELTGMTSWAGEETDCGWPARAGAATETGAARAAGRRPVAVGCMGRNPGNGSAGKRRAAQAAALQHILGLRTPLGVAYSCRFPGRVRPGGMAVIEVGAEAGRKTRRDAGSAGVRKPGCTVQLAGLRSGCAVALRRTGAGTDAGKAPSSITAFNMSRPLAIDSRPSKPLMVPLSIGAVPNSPQGDIGGERTGLNTVVRLPCESKVTCRIPTIIPGMHCHYRVASVSVNSRRSSQCPEFPYARRIGVDGSAERTSPVIIRCHRRSTQWPKRVKGMGISVPQRSHSARNGLAIELPRPYSDRSCRIWNPPDGEIPVDPGTRFGSDSSKPRLAICQFAALGSRIGPPSNDPARR